jgi:hypothetical protein
MSKKQETTEVVKAETTAVANVAANLGDWGESSFTSNDIIIPKVLLMQGLSDLVSDGKAKLGDMVDNSTSQILGGFEKPLKIVPFHMEKVWIISQKEKGKERFEFVEYQPVTPENINQPWTAVEGDTQIKREYTLQFYCIDPEAPVMPFVVSFKSSSARAGKVLSTQMYVRNRAAGLVPPAYVMELSSKKEKNDQGTYAVYEVKPLEKTSDDLIAKSLEWFKLVKAGKTQVSVEEPQGEMNFAADNVAF